MPLIQLDTNLFVADTHLKLAGIDLGGRMTIIRLPGSRLWIHSPIHMDDALAEEIKKLGTVSYIVAPNLFHNRFVRLCHTYFPQAALFGPPGISRKVPGLQIDSLNQPPESFPWADGMDTQMIPGMPGLKESVFFHRESRTLIVTDLVFHFTRPSDWWTTLFMKVYGIYKKFGPSIAIRLSIRDKAQFRQAIQAVCNWDFSRLIMAHGEIVTENARSRFQKAFRL